jgi:hypothetical protein
MQKSSKGWRITWYATFADVVPVDDIKEHFLGDECWCGTKIIDSTHFKDGLTRVVHNSADRREFDELTYGGEQHGHTAIGS